MEYLYSTSSLVSSRYALKPPIVTYLFCPPLGLLHSPPPFDTYKYWLKCTH